jgi:predicted metalloprotease with PDZ domain
MQAMYARHGRGQAGYTVEDVARIAGELTDSDFRPFVAGLVEIEGVVDLRPALAHLGLRMDQFFDEVYISPDESATPAQVGRFEAIFGRSR